HDLTPTQPAVAQTEVGFYSFVRLLGDQVGAGDFAIVESPAVAGDHFFFGHMERFRNAQRYRMIWYVADVWHFSEFLRDFRRCFWCDFWRDFDGRLWCFRNFGCFGDFRLNEEFKCQHLNRDPIRQQIACDDDYIALMEDRWCER